MIERIGFNLTIICIVALLCITALEIVAIAYEMNGVLLVSTIGLLIGLPTFLAGRLFKKKE